MSKDNLYEILSSVKTDVGLKRDHNEDNFFVSNNGRICIVADGMGGHENGEIASEVIRYVSEQFSYGFEDGTYKLDTKNSNDFLGYVIGQSIDELTKRFEEQQIKQETGSTFVGLVLDDAGWVNYAHVGDSRAYLLRQGELTQLTQDHSFLNEYIKRGGEISEEDRENFPNKNIITKAIRPCVETDYDNNSLPVEVGDVYLLCSDGLTDMVCDDKIAEILRNRDVNNPCEQEDLDQCIDDLIDIANRKGGDDNITISLMKINYKHRELPEPYAVPEPLIAMVEEYDEEEGSYTLENHEELLGENKDLKTKISEWEDHCVSLTRELNESKFLSSKLQLEQVHVSEKLNKINDEFNVVKREYRNLTDQFEKLYSEKGDLEEQIGKLQIENANLENESLDHNGDLARLEKQLENTKDKLFDTSLENQSLKYDAIAVVEPKIKVKNRVYGLLAGITLSVAAMVGYNSINSSVESQNIAQQEVVSVDPAIEYQREINIIKTDLITEQTSCDTARENFQNAERLCPDMTDCQDIRNRTSKFLDDFCN